LDDTAILVKDRWLGRDLILQLGTCLVDKIDSLVRDDGRNLKKVAAKRKE
jgi:hypothetical protein